MKIGNGWAPEPPKNKLSQFAIHELHTLLERLFTNPRTKLRGPRK